MKGQSHTIQFILFLFMGMMVWLAFLGLFKNQFDIFRTEIVKGNSKLVSSHLSAGIITAYTSCVKCRTVQTVVDFPTATYAGDFLTFDFNKSSDGSLTVSDSTYYSYSSSIHSLNTTLQILGQCQDSLGNPVSCNSANRKLTLTIDKANNILKVV